MTSEEEANENLVRSWINDVLQKQTGSSNEWLEHVRRKAPEYWDENYLAHHDPTAKGRDGLVERLAVLASAFSSTKVEILAIIAKGDMVADCIRISGIHTGPFLGIPPAGKNVSWLQNEMFKLKDGKIVEGWVTRDWLGLLQQLGAMGRSNK